jgi:hypothetical protein
VYGTFWGTGPDYYHAVLKTTDGGQSWEEKTNGLDTIPTGHRIYWVASHPLTDDTLYLATSYGAFKSTDAGESWVKKNSYHLYWIEVDPVEPYRLYATTACAAYYSSDGGENWVDRSNGLSNMSDVMMIDVDPQSNNVVYAALCGLETMDPNSGIYRSTDHGAQWTRMSSGLPNMPILRPRVLVDSISTSIWATTPLLGTGIPGVYRSNDQASSWFPETDNLNTNRTTFFALGEYPYLATQYSGIWAFYNVGIAEHSGKEKKRYFSVYPNPSRGPVTIQYEIQNTGTVRMKLIDRIGRIVTTNELSQEPGIHTMVIDDALPAGVYFIVMELNGECSTESVVLIR